MSVPEVFRFCPVCGMDTERMLVDGPSHIGERWACCNEEEHRDRVLSVQWLLASQPVPDDLPDPVRVSVLAWWDERRNMARAMAADLVRLGDDGDPEGQEEARRRVWDVWSVVDGFDPGMPSGFEGWPGHTRQIVYRWCREVERQGRYLVGLLRGAASTGDA